MLTLASLVGVVGCDKSSSSQPEPAPDTAAEPSEPSEAAEPGPEAPPPGEWRRAGSLLEWDAARGRELTHGSVEVEDVGQETPALSDACGEKWSDEFFDSLPSPTGSATCRREGEAALECRALIAHAYLIVARRSNRGDGDYQVYETAEEGDGIRPRTGLDNFDFVANYISFPACVE